MKRWDRSGPPAMIRFIPHRPGPSGIPAPTHCVPRAIVYRPDRADFHDEVNMKATAEIQVIPVGVGVSVRKQVRRAHAVLVEAGLEPQLHPNGTNVEGELADIFEGVRRVHETLHAEGVPRLETFIKIGTRTDKEPSLSGKMF